MLFWPSKNSQSLSDQRSCKVFTSLVNTALVRSFEVRLHADSSTGFVYHSSETKCAVCTACLYFLAYIHSLNLRNLYSQDLFLVAGILLA